MAAVPEEADQVHASGVGGNPAGSQFPPLPRTTPAERRPRTPPLSMQNALALASQGPIALGMPPRGHVGGREPATGDVGGLPPGGAGMMGDQTARAAFRGFGGFVAGKDELQHAAPPGPGIFRG